MNDVTTGNHRASLIHQAFWLEYLHGPLAGTLLQDNAVEADAAALEPERE